MEILKDIKYLGVSSEDTFLLKIYENLLLLFEVNNHYPFRKYRFNYFI